MENEDVLGIPKVVLYNPSEQRLMKNPVLPLALMTVGTALKKEGYEVQIVDARLGDRIDDALTDDTVMAGMTVMTGTVIKDALKSSKTVKDYDKCIKTSWGGWHPSLMPEQTLENEYVDEVVKGRFRDDEPIDYEIIDLERYIRDENGVRTIDYLSSRGCTHRCRYCAIGKVYERKWFSYPMKKIISDIGLFIEKYNVGSIHFMDDNFFVNQKRVEKICDAILSNGWKLKIWAMCRIDYFSRFDDRFLLKLKKAGFETFNFGFESGSQHMLDYMRKDITVEQGMETARKCERYGFNAEFSFMIGFPNETREDVVMTLNAIDEVTKIIECDIKLFLYCPYPGTDMYDDALKMGLKEPRSLEEWEDFEYENLVTPWVPDETKKLFDKITYMMWFAFTPALETKWARKPHYKLACRMLKRDARFRWRHRLFGFAPEWKLVKFLTRGNL